MVPDSLSQVLWWCWAPTGSGTTAALSSRPGDHAGNAWNTVGRRPNQLSFLQVEARLDANWSAADLQMQSDALGRDLQRGSPACSATRPPRAAPSTIEERMLMADFKLMPVVVRLHPPLVHDRARAVLASPSAPASWAPLAHILASRSAALARA